MTGNPEVIQCKSRNDGNVDVTTENRNRGLDADGAFKSSNVHLVPNNAPVRARKRFSIPVDLFIEMSKEPNKWANQRNGFKHELVLTLVETVITAYPATPRTIWVNGESLSY